MSTLLHRNALRAAALTPAAALIAAALPSGAASADTAPPQGTPATVSADPLPTWQVDGVVWSMTTVGNTVYAVGNFTRARPPGAAPGSSSEVPRRNILAFDITTGNLIKSFNHSLNGQGLRVVASPDRSRIYVGGEFTAVNGKPRHRLAAFDTKSGKLVEGFQPRISNVVRAIAATNDAVYFGGNFFAVNGSSRTRLAAVRARDGSSINTWKPTVDDEVHAMVMSPSGKRVIIGGRFQKLNGKSRVGIGAVRATDGATATWTSDPIPARSGGNFSYTTDLYVADGVLYGSANGQGRKWFDGRYAADPENGDLIWLDNCYGATYGVYATGKVLYSVNHAHDCSSLGAFPESPSRRALATTTYAVGRDPAPPSANSKYRNQPVPGLLHWFPALGTGSFTGQYQAAWTITGNGKYIALGGEFPTANGTKQQGLTRYAIRSLAPNKIRPQAASTLTPTVTRRLDGKVTVRWKATWDQDNHQLTYEVLRGTQVVHTRKVGSNFWTLPNQTYVDAAPPGTHVYRIRVTDPLGNRLTSGESQQIRIR